MKKKIIVSNVFSFILGAIIFGCIGAYAATLISASEVQYKDTNVSSALNDLYEKSNQSTENNECDDSMNFAVRIKTKSTGNTDASLTIYVGVYEEGVGYTWFGSTNKTYSSASNYTEAANFIKYRYIASPTYKWEAVGLNDAVVSRDASGNILDTFGTSSTTWSYGASIDYYFTAR